MPWLYDELPDLLEQFPPFIADRAKWRALAVGTSRAGYSRTTGPLDDLPFPRLLELQAAGWQRDRPRQWPDELRNGSDPELGNAHVSQLLAAYSRAGGRYLGATWAAPALHDHTSTDERITVPSGLAIIYPTGPTASAVIELFSGPGWNPSLERHWQRWRKFAFARTI